ncbi:cytochrome P450 [Mycena pura]|uniref:Cytochrome P450 n=1 Tax=Mycena pura TaxID=153505 RepID=A0AAD6YCG9_9AGAR|nr:cytochrome P450 [Mycena pura]
MDTLDIKTLVIYGLAATVAIYYLGSRKQSTTIPAMGSSGPIKSNLAALHFLRHGQQVISTGYSKYRNGVFRVPMLFRWDYIANGPERVREIVSAPEHVLSFDEGVSDVREPYHVQVIRGQLTRNLGRCFPEVRDEIVNAFNDVLTMEGTEWKLIKVLPATMQIVSRTSNRIFVGLPLCRDIEYVQLNIDYTVTIFTRGQIIGLLPGFLKPIVAPFLSPRKSSLRHALKLLKTILEERLEQENKYGRDRPDRPNDLISWLLDIAVGDERTAPALALRILVTNMAAIHTSSTTLTAALYDLAMYPEHIEPMREEAERVIMHEGWTKAAFLRESQRLRGAGPVALMRKVVAKDEFRFADGTTIPRGAFLSVPGMTVHLDPVNYDQPAVFDGFRFSRRREAGSPGPGADADATSGGDRTGERSMFNRHMISTGEDHLVFGHGRHACPGRFFAATELKAMLAHILQLFAEHRARADFFPAVINYDIRAEEEGVRPPDMEFGLLRAPNANGKIWMRKREGV